jgi:hypothetical protein
MKLRSDRTGNFGLVEAGFLFFIRGGVVLLSGGEDSVQIEFVQLTKFLAICLG